MNERATLQRILERDRVIAVVGLSKRPHRPSYSVSAYMQSRGYRIVPINPAYSNDAAGVLGERCFATLTEAVEALADEGLSIGLVNVFRRPEEVLPVADEAVRIKARSLWLQLGVINYVAAEHAEAAGLDVAMDHCLKIEHGRILGATHHLDSPAPRIPRP
jgi:predicted CoA-binding protein